MLERIGKAFILQLSILAALAFFLSGCGRKAPPVPPLRPAPPVVNDLSWRMEEDTLTLTWTVPQHDGRIHPILKGFSVYRSKTPLSESECRNCSIRFKRVADISRAEVKSSMGLTKGVMTYSQTLGKGYRYIYKVGVDHDTGMTVRDSNRVEINYR